MVDELKVFYTPGDLVKIKHEKLENRPIMLVKEKVEKIIKNKDGSYNASFVGMKCMWFDKNQELHESIFSTKDLIHV